MEHLPISSGAPWVPFIICGFLDNPVIMTPAMWRVFVHEHIVNYGFTLAEVFDTRFWRHDEDPPMFNLKFHTETQASFPVTIAAWAKERGIELDDPSFATLVPNPTITAFREFIAAEVKRIEGDSDYHGDTIWSEDAVAKIGVPFGNWLTEKAALRPWEGHPTVDVYQHSSDSIPDRPKDRYLIISRKQLTSSV